MQAGNFLQATAALEGDYFEKAVLLITEYNENGAIGFVVNKKFPKTFNELNEFRHSPALPLWEGGPVDQEHLFVLHHVPHLIPNSRRIQDDLYEGGDFAETVKLLNNNTINSQQIRMSVGYCGWDKGDLEAEIAEGSWVLLPGYSLWD